MSSLRTDLVVSTLLSLSDLEWDSFRQLESIYETMSVDARKPEQLVNELSEQLPPPLRRRLDELATEVIVDDDPSVVAMVKELERRLYLKRNCDDSLEPTIDDATHTYLFEHARWLLLITVLDPAL